jgi:MFS-type transporter involved in bile tolerance (Atg22 family)
LSIVTILYAIFLHASINVVQFPVESRAIYGLSLTAAVFLFDLLLPVLGFAIKNWKLMQGVISAPLVITGVLYW